MISASVVDGATVLAGELPTAGSAYVDADWVPAGSGTVPALVVPGGDTEAAAASLAAVAAEAASIARAEPAARVDVVGRGFTAAAIRRLLGLETAAVGADRVGAIVLAVSSAEALSGAMARLDDLGLLVLAGEPHGPTPLDLYADVHVRGLRLRGVGPARPAVERGPAPPDGWAPPADVRLGEPLDPSASWYRVVPAAGG